MAHIEGSELVARLSADQLAYLESVGEERHFEENEILFSEDGSADEFHVIVSGRVGLELSGPRMGPLVIQTLGRGDLVGLSWLFPPYRWAWRARARVATTTIAFDAAQVREQCDRDVSFDRAFTSIVAREALRRLQATRTQILDLYEVPK
ncbi:MAG: cyclic nucleotide-binding domain-containing protein [Acidimicrobiia bacterium]|nr:cyclic nucleotide-binding domain-containing protein [Acidimicrobiia bacterium]